MITLEFEQDDDCVINFTLLFPMQVLDFQENQREKTSCWKIRNRGALRAPEMEQVEARVFSKVLDSAPSHLQSLP